MQTLRKPNQESTVPPGSPDHIMYMGTSDQTDDNTKVKLQMQSDYQAYNNTMYT